MNAALEKLKTFKNKIKKPGKELFWVWVGYQAVKGTLTLSFIWIPAFLYWFNK